MTYGNIYNWQENTEKGYSIGWNLKTLISKGLPKKDPPTNLKELLEQIITLVSESRTEWSGPQTINSLDSYITLFVEKENLDTQNLSYLFKAFFQKIYENALQLTISLDLVSTSDFPNTKQNTLEKINHVLQNTALKFMEKGLFEPYIVVNIYQNTDWNSETLDEWLKLSYMYGQPVYHNFQTGTIGPESLRPRDQKPELDTIHLRLGGANGNSENQSVTGFSCINLEKIGAEAKTENQFFNILGEKMDEAARFLAEKRQFIEDKFNHNGFRLTKWFIEDLNWSYSVITLVGMNEALESLIDAPLGHVAGKAVTYKVLEFLLRKIEDIQCESGQLFSLESHPSDTPGGILLQEYESQYPFLTTATELKPSHGDDLWDSLEHQKKYHSMYTGGTLKQIHLEKGLNYNSGLKLLIRRIVENFGYNYLAITPIFSLCIEHGYVPGTQDTCPECGKNTETYTRIDTKITPVSSLQSSLKEAYRQRVYYDVKNE
jgi:ribonucleoside-triphosphate reductase